MFSRTGFVLARLCVASYAVLTASYCLLAYVPFTYYQIHLGGLLPWLSTFAQLHAYLYWPVLLLAAVTLPTLRNDRTRSFSVLFVFVFGVIGVRVWTNPLLVHLGDEKVNLLWCLLSMAPLLWLGILDWRAVGRDLVWEAEEHAETRHIFLACLLTSAYVWLLSAGIGAARSWWYGKQAFAGGWLVVLSGSLLFHVATFMAVFMALNFTLVLARLFSSRPDVHAYFCGATATAAALAVVKCVVFARLSFTGWWADLVAFAAAASLVIFLLGTRARLCVRDERPMHSALELLVFPRWLRSIPPAARGLYLIAGSVVAGCALITAARFDWGHLIQILIVLLSWAAVFGFFYISRPARATGYGWGTDRLLLGAAMLICLCMGAVAVGPRLSAQSRAAQWGVLLEQYSNYDVGFLVARGALSPSAARQGSSLYSFLASNTNIPRSVLTEPVEVSLVRNLRPNLGPKPNIFILVIDSLRRDYLSPYNSRVRFTPAIEEFARGSVVMQNAFTHYAGTGLSEPSIWAGAMLLHKQYVTPFYPMNSLQKLLDADQYRQFISMDDILTTILKPSPLLVPLDAGRPTMGCELCRTLAELQSRIVRTDSGGQPIFSFAQPQNIHISVIRREGRTAPEDNPSEGFDAAYVTRIRRMDRCFGEFIRFLKDRGMYENSVVILTSDHGDALGEEGRWGHAYNVVPGVVRIPLVIHLPASSRALAVEQHSPAFLTDIAPSLYYLLGHRPIESNPIFGRPLFTGSSEEGSRYFRDSYLIASSYAPVYAVLSNGGRSLYVVDGVEYDDYVYDLKDPNHAGSVTPEVRANGQRFLRDSIQDIANFYHFGLPDGPSSVN